MNPFLVVLSSPSGAGKTSIVRELLAKRADVGYSVSCTTRPPRGGERDGIDYHFVDRAAFGDAKKRGEFAESAEVHGELYGTLRSEVDRVLGSGRHVVMDIDVQGARQLAATYPQSVLVFVLPPSAGALVERLKARRTEEPVRLARRLKSAIEELRAVPIYHYVVINDDLPSAVARVSAIIDAEAARQGRASGIDSRVQRLIDDLEQAIQPLSAS